MRKLFSSIAIGVFAGVIDVIPMLVQKKGVAIGFFSALSIAILVAQSDPASILPILMTSLVLGALVSVLTRKFAA